MSDLYTIIVYVNGKPEWLHHELRTFHQEASDMASRYTLRYADTGRIYRAVSEREAERIMGEA